MGVGERIENEPLKRFILNRVCSARCSQASIPRVCNRVAKWSPVDEVKEHKG